MSLSSLCIKRPVFTIVLSVLLSLVGLYCFQKLQVSRLPNIEQSKITITTYYSGASPQLIENDITTPIENAVSSINGIDSLKSASELGQSTVNLKFKLDTNMVDATSEVRNKVEAISGFLPPSAKNPIVRKIDDSSSPTLILGLTSETRSPLQLTDYANRYLKPQLEQLNGVGQVLFYGGREYALKIWLNPESLSAKRVNVSEIVALLKEQNVDIPSGQIKSKMKNYNLIAHSKLDNVSAIKRLIIKSNREGVVRLEDVAELELTANQTESIFRINGKNAIGLAIIAQETANPINVSKSINRYFDSIKPTLPEDLKFNVVFDSSLFIKKSIKEVYKTFFEATLFVAIIIFLFLGSLRSSAIPLVTVPICLIASFFPMYLFGFSLNTISLLALVLAIGLVVDDAIVILENCYRHLQNGQDKMSAALSGTKEVQFAIVAMTLTLAAVYTPLAFIRGFSGKLYLEFGMTLAISVIFSGFIALSLSPMMSARLLRRQQGHYANWLDKRFNGLQNYYKSLLARVLPLKKTTLLIIVILLTLSALSYQSLPKALAPSEDQGYIFGIMSPPQSASLKYTYPYTKSLEKVYESLAEKKGYLTVTTPNNIFSVLQLSSWDNRIRPQKVISEEINQAMQNFTGVTGFAVNPSPLGRRGENNGFQLKVMSYASLSRLEEAISDLKERLQKYPNLRNVDDNLSTNQFQFDIEFNRALMAELNIPMSDSANLISTMLSGANPGEFSFNGQNYPIYLQLKESLRSEPSVLKKMYLQNNMNQAIPLSQVATIKSRNGPMSLNHYNKMKSADIVAELKPNANYGKVITDVKEMLKQSLPEDIKVSFTGAAKDYLDSKSSTLTAFLLALIFIYLILAAQFESFITPFIILLTVPGSMLGGLGFLYLNHANINLYSSMGLVTLIGLISKHGILIIEFCEQNLKRGLSLDDSIITGAALRLRPILMTTLAMVLGALPLLLGSGAGAEARRQLGMVIVGGMSLGTLFSLFIVPMAYYLIYSRKSPKTVIPAQEGI